MMPSLMGASVGPPAVPRLLLVDVEVRAQAAPRARPGDDLDRPADAVAPEQEPGLPAQVSCLGPLAVGERDDRAGRQVEPGLDDAVIAQRDAKSRVGAQQAPLADRDDLLAAAGQGALDRRAAADVASPVD